MLLVTEVRVLKEEDFLLSDGGNVPVQHFQGKC